MLKPNEIRPDLACFGLDDDALVFSEQAQRFAILNHSAGMITRRLAAGAQPEEIARELVFQGLTDSEAAPLWVSDTIATLRANGLTGEALGREPAVNPATPSEGPLPPSGDLPLLEPYKVVAEKTYSLLTTRALVRFGLKSQIAWVDAALGHLTSKSPEPPTVTFDIPGEEFLDGRRFASVYRNGECLRANVRLSGLAPIVKSAFWQSAVNAYDFLFNFHAGVVARNGYCVLLPAPAGSGKSSLTAALTHSGFEYFSDEVAIIEPQSFRVPRVPLALCVKSSGWDVIAEFYPRILHLPVHQRGDGKTVRYLRAIAVNSTGNAAVSHIIFPRYDRENPTEIRNVTRADALRRLMDECVAVRRRLTRADVEGLAHWMAGIECHALTFSSLTEAVELVTNAVANQRRASATNVK